jgi:hypothetical protein
VHAPVFVCTDAPTRSHKPTQLYIKADSPCFRQPSSTIVKRKQAQEASLIMGLLEDGLKEDDLSMGLDDTRTGIIAPPRTE